MVVKVSSLLFFILIIMLSGCGKKKDNVKRIVELKEVNGAYQLYRHGKPYYIKGAGGDVNLDKVKAYGGNSVRVWTTDNAQKILDEAHKLGLTVILGLDVGRERLGFDYDNDSLVARQFARLKKEVIKYKDHPALLMWGVGNEVDQLGNNKKVWDAVNDLAKMIHEIDPNHPTTTMIVPHREKIWTVKWKCPEIDILSFNTFDEIPKLSGKLREWIWGWDGAYIVTEWGSSGWWETDRTAWDAAIEPTSTVKAGLLRKYYKLIENDKNKCIGSYVFYWGAKQERTPTWFSLFLETGHETESVQIMQHNWTGKRQENRAPKISGLYLDEKSGKDNIFLSVHAEYKCRVTARDPDKDSLFYLWTVMPESTDLNGGGDWEKQPEPRYDLISDLRAPVISVKAPEKEGPYRLFVYVYDNKNHVATANIPFYVIP